MNRLSLMLCGSLILSTLIAGAAEDRRQQVIQDRDEVRADGRWIYNDFGQGVAEATRTRKPMLVVFRCIP